MRNIFDQYDAPENRLTHALGCCLQRDPCLLRRFIRWARSKDELPTGKLDVVEQQIPGAPLPSWNEDESRGLPDLWIHDQGTWSLLVESKVKATVSTDQLRRHLRTAERNGFTSVALLVLAPEVPQCRAPRIAYRTWPELYAWLRRQLRSSDWAESMVQYMEAAEERMTTEGYLGDLPLTRFDGIPFGPEHPYSYREAKRVLRLAMGELRQRPDLRKLGMDPAGTGRPAITGREGTAVWDFLPLREARDRCSFTSYPHLTLGVQDQRVHVIVTLPNGAPAYMRKKLIDGGLDAFKVLVMSVEARVSRAARVFKSARPIIEVVQRHYPSQRSTPVVDARLEFDPRTVGNSANGNVKKQEQWLEAVFRALERKQSNIQVGIGAVLPYRDRRINSRDVLNVIAGVRIGCKPWIDAIIQRR